jgi:hypothetical protein
VEGKAEGKGEEEEEGGDDRLKLRSTTLSRKEAPGAAAVVLMNASRGAEALQHGVEKEAEEAEAEEEAVGKS